VPGPTPARCAIFDTANMYSYGSSEEIHDRGGAQPAAMSGQGAGLAEEPEVEWLAEVIERAVNGVKPPDYAGVPDSGAVSPVASPARP
jgi:hypothetical protein